MNKQIKYLMLWPPIQITKWNKSQKKTSLASIMLCWNALKPVFNGSSWCEHVLRGPGCGGHWNHQVFDAPSHKLHQNLRVSDQDPCRGGVHHHLLHRHPGEPAAQWRTLQVRFTQQRRRLSGCRASAVTLCPLCPPHSNCAAAQSSIAGRDDGTALKLWAASCHMLSIRWRWRCARKQD